MIRDSEKQPLNADSRVSAPRVAIRVCLLTIALFLEPNSIRAQVFERVYPLQANEHVYSYARVAPDGHRLLYASAISVSDSANTERQQLHLVNLETKAVEFETGGIDGYWSPNGDRFIFERVQSGKARVAIHNVLSGENFEDVADPGLGDYYSWGVQGGRDIIATVDGAYYYLNASRAVAPAYRIPTCPGEAPTERPLISKDGLRVSGFRAGTVVVRNLTDCQDMIEVGLRGAKADFSWDGRYIAFHAPRIPGPGYDILIVDLAARTVRNVTARLKGISLFPSWTRDGRVCFRYQGADYDGFVIAGQIQSVEPRPLPATPEHLPSTRTWSFLFPGVARPKPGLALVLIWSPFVAHTNSALEAFRRVARESSTRVVGQVHFYVAADPAGWKYPLSSSIRGASVKELRLHASQFRTTEAVNQSPTILLFSDGVLLDHRLGSQTSEQLFAWIKASAHREQGLR
jgi:hypothetical protein